MGIVTICIPYDQFAQITLDPARPEHITPEEWATKIIKEYYAKQKEAK